MKKREDAALTGVDLSSIHKYKAPGAQTRMPPVNSLIHGLLPRLTRQAFREALVQVTDRTPTLKDVYTCITSAFQAGCCGSPVVRTGRALHRKQEERPRWVCRDTERAAGFKGQRSLGSQVLISPQTDVLLNSLKCQKR